MSYPPTITVCTGGRGSPEMVAMAREVGRMLADNGIFTIFGGAKIGCMGAVADGVLEQGGQIIGYLPTILRDKEIQHPSAELFWVNTMSDRKKRMFERSDAFLVLPGAIGTMDELFDFWAQIKLGYANKRIAIFNYRSFYTQLYGQLAHMVEDGFMPQDRADILEWLYFPGQVDKWLASVAKGEKRPIEADDGSPR